jgi:phage baseplate assembly protein W
MAIKIQTLEKIATEINTDFFYKDLTLDVSQTKIIQPGFENSVPGSDIQASFDTKAIINSLTNLFNTLPGQRFLFPEYGLDLYQFLFEPITETTAQMIGNKMHTAIKKFEPRVIVRKIIVDGKPDENAYIISIFLEIPVLRTNFETLYNFDLKRQSIISIPTSRNK